MIEGPLEIETIESAPFAENTYVAHLAAGTACVVFDPGMEPDRIVEYVERRGLQPAARRVTHGHADHIAGRPELKQRWPAVPIVIGRGEANKLVDAWENLSAQFGLPVTTPPADVLLDEGPFTVGGLEFDVAAIPGHSSGHVVFIWRGGPRPVVFGGDVLFQGSIGRTDFPGGSFAALAAGIRSKLYVLPDDALVLPGHGPPTTIGREKRSNPFVSGTT